MLAITSITTRPETREAWLQSFIELSRPLFEDVGAPLPETVRASIGFCSTGRKGKRIGECWSAQSTADSVCEIFITPTLQHDTVAIAATLTHELIHAAVGHEAKHGPKFRKPAVALGLEGKMTATVAGPKWIELHHPLLDQLGKFPAEELKAGTNGEKKQGTRMVKVQCNSCEFSYRTSQKNIDLIVDDACPASCSGTMGVA